MRESEIETAKTINNLDQWLVRRGLSVRRAIFTSESIKRWTYDVAEALGEGAQIGVEVSSVSVSGVEIWLPVLFPEPFTLRAFVNTDAQRFRKLCKQFEQSVGRTLLPNPYIHTPELFSLQELTSSFAENLQEGLLPEQEFIGVINAAKRLKI